MTSEFEAIFFLANNLISKRFLRMIEKLLKLWSLFLAQVFFKLVYWHNKIFDWYCLKLGVCIAFWYKLEFKKNVNRLNEVEGLLVPMYFSL